MNSTDQVSQIQSISSRSQEAPDLDESNSKFSKKRRISQSTDGNEQDSKKLRLRKQSILKKQELQAKEISLRENELREYLFLQSGGNIIEYNPLSVELMSALETYHTTHRLTSPQPKADSAINTNGTVPKVVDSSLKIQIKSNPASGLAVTQPSKEDIASKASKDAEILKRVSELQKEGFWSTKRISKLAEPARNKVHWDFLLAEMAWLANDFKEERKFKTALAKKVSRQVAKHFESIHSKEKREAKEEEANIRKRAKQIATQVKRFWNQIEKLVQYKQQLKADEEKKKALDKQLDLLVGQTEKYSEMLAQDLAAAANETTVPTETPTENHNNNHETTALEQFGIQTLLENNLEAEKLDEDQDFAPQEEPPTDDETTIAQEEKDNSELQQVEMIDEAKTLETESNLPLEDVLKTYQPGENDVESEQEAEVEDENNNMDEDEPQDSKEKINEAAIAARAAQPTGFTLSTTKVKTKVPFLLRGTLREYQHIGLDWLVTMYDKNLNGILADEMGLGKTVMTISLLAHLACEKELWGPHLIVVPTSLMLNWELELKRWCPGFKVLTYYGSPKERKAKRQGWTKPNSFHVCITSYKLVIQDQAAFRRKQWDYLILDEAQHIKNFKSQRWQVLLNFNSKHRLLLTGTPLQNNLMELWSLMHFLMPHIFESHKEFKDWFSNPVTSMIEGEQDVNEDLINRLHGVLRPFLLRRLKSEVEKQLPQKYQHVVKCKLSKRQRFLYEEFMSNAATKNTLASGNFLGIMNALMQLRKVCNHPDLFEVRPIVSPFDQDPIVYKTSSLVCRALDKDPLETLSLPLQSLQFLANELFSPLETREIAALTPSDLQFTTLLASEIASFKHFQGHNRQNNPFSLNSASVSRKQQLLDTQTSNIHHQSYINKFRTFLHVVHGRSLRHIANITKPSDIHQLANNPHHYLDFCNSLKDIILTPGERAQKLAPLLENFVCIIPKARSHPIQLHCCHPNPSTVSQQNLFQYQLLTAASPLTDVYRIPYIRQQLYFPDKRLIQYDCGKLQELALLLRILKSGGHRALIFTQMTKVLDILEIFLNIHGYTYLRLDGATRVEKRQMLMERFNRDNKIFLFILSTRSGGIGINLTGADTVIFYDSDWNPAMDAQAQDRCHRIGQTREVHIYRLISEHTVEENILKKSNQKKYLDDLVITGGSFTPDFFKKLDLRELIEGESNVKETAPRKALQVSEQDWVKAVSTFDDETDTTALRSAQAEQEDQLEDFNEEAIIPEEVVQDKEGLDEEDVEQEQPTEDLFEGRLTAIQRYALRYLENGSEESTSIELLKVSEEEKLKENEEEALDQDEVLFYEVHN